MFQRATFYIDFKFSIVNDGYSNPSSPNRVSSLVVFPVRGLNHEAPIHLQWESQWHSRLSEWSWRKWPNTRRWCGEKLCRKGVPFIPLINHRPKQLSKYFIQPVKSDTILDGEIINSSQQDKIQTPLMVRNTQETQEPQIFAGGRQTSRKPNCLNTFGNQVNLSRVSHFDTNLVPDIDPDPGKSKRILEDGF